MPETDHIRELSINIYNRSMPRTRRQSLKDEKAALVRRLKEIDIELIKIDRASGEPFREGDKRKQGEKSGSPTKPLRQIIIAMLSDVGYMLSNTVIRQLYEARYQKVLTGSRLGTLSQDELKRKNKWNTTVYGLTHPIQLVNKEILRVKNVWARSDWSVDKRAHLPTTEALINLHFLDWYITTKDSRGYEYLKSQVMQRYIDGVIINLNLAGVIRQPFDSMQAKKIIINEIERVNQMEEKEYSPLKFEILSAHKQSKKYYDPDMDAETDMKA